MAESMQGPLEIGNLHHITTYQAGALQASARRALRKHCDDILSPYGITKNQWLVIGVVLDAGKPGIRPKEIACLVDSSAEETDSTIKTLEKKNMLLCRGQNEAANNIIVTLHPDFAPDCPEIEQILRKALRKSIYSKITPLEFRIYLKVLYQLSQLP